MLECLAPIRESIRSSARSFHREARLEIDSLKIRFQDPREGRNLPDDNEARRGLTQEPAGSRFVHIKNRMLLQPAQMKTAKCCTRLSKWSVSGSDRTHSNLFLSSSAMPGIEQSRNVLLHRTIRLLESKRYLALESISFVGIKKWQVLWVNELPHKIPLSYTFQSKYGSASS